MRTLDGRIMVEPFKETGIKASTSASGIRYIGNYDSLESSVAIADCPGADIKKGDVVYVAGTSVKAPWAKLVFDLGAGVKGVLVPKEAVVLVDPKS